MGYYSELTLEAEEYLICEMGEEEYNMLEAARKEKMIEEVLNDWRNAADARCEAYNDDIEDFKRNEDRIGM